MVLKINTRIWVQFLSSQPKRTFPTQPHGPNWPKANRFLVLHHHSLRRLGLRTHSAQTDRKSVAEYKQSHQTTRVLIIKSSLRQLDPVKTYASPRGFYQLRYPRPSNSSGESPCHKTISNSQIIISSGLAR